MADAIKSKNIVHTSTPAPNRKVNAKKLFELSTTQETSVHVVKKQSMIEMLINAIKAVGLPKKGASLPAIKKWIIANSASAPRNQNAALKRAIEKAIETRMVIRPPHSKDARGLTGWFALPPSPKKVKDSPQKNETTKETVKSPKVNEKVLKSAKGNVKEPKATQEIKVKKGSKKNVKPLPKEISEEEANKNIASSPEAIVKKGAKKNPVSSKEISKKETKKDIALRPKTAVKKGPRNKPLTLTEVNENRYMFSDSDDDKENIENINQEPELTAQKKINTTKALKQKAIKTKEQPKIKNAVGKGEKAVQSKKVNEQAVNSNSKDITKQSKTTREPLKEIDDQVKTKVKKTNSELNGILSQDDLNKTRKDMSDTELDIKPNRPKSIKSYASDTELEISRRMVPSSKKAKPERKALIKKVRKNTSEITAASAESDMDDSKPPIKSQNQSKLRKAKKNES